MLKDYLHLDLLGHRVFDKLIAKPPLKMEVKMLDEACFYFVMTGRAKLNTPTEEIDLQSEEGIVMQCGRYLNEYISQAKVEYCETFIVHLYPEILRNVYKSEIPDVLINVDNIKPLKYSKYKATQLMSAYFNSMKFYFDHPELVSEELLKLKIKELIIILAKTDNLQSIRDLFASLFNTYEYDFKEIIEANIYSDLSVGEIATLTNMSLSSFKRAFTKQYNTSPARFIRDRKLEKSAKLLKGSKLRITQIAFECGFNDLANFSKCFLRKYGVSPSTFRLTQMD